MRHQPADGERAGVEDVVGDRHTECALALDEELDEPDRVVADVGQAPLVGQGVRGRHGGKLPDEAADVARDVPARAGAQADLLPAA